MLNRISAALQSAVDTIAPPVPLLHDFVYHWRQLMRFYDSPAEALNVPIESTHLPNHMDHMLKALQEEQEESRRLGVAETGPCLEYLLQHRVPDLLASLACADTPSGMRHLGLVTFARLITMTSDHLLVQAALHEPVQRMIRLCGQMSASPTEAQEVRLLCVLVAIIGQRPQLSPLFCLPRSQSPTKPAANGASSAQEPASQAESTISVTSQPKLPQRDNLLADALLRYIDSADHRLRVKACESLLVLVSTPSLGALLAQHSALAECLALRLATLYRAMPAALDPADMEEVQASWGMDNPLEVREQFPGCRQLAAFLSWLDYCDKVAGEGREDAVGAALVREVHTALLAPELAPRIATGARLATALAEPQHHEEELEQVRACCVTLSLVARMLRLCRAPSLRDGLVSWLVTPAAEEGAVRDSLVRLLDLGVSDLAIETMRLFEVLVEEPRSPALQALIFGHAASRINQTETPPMPENSASRYPPSQTLAPSNIHLVLEGFLQLLPPSLRSVETEAGYESYLQDAQRQYEAAWVRCSSLGFPLEASSGDEDCASSDSRPEADLPPEPRATEEPASLLPLLLGRLERFPQQEYEVNLQLTALLSRLALLPHAALHEALLSPTPPTQSGGSSSTPPSLPAPQTLGAALRRLANRLAEEASGIPNLQSRLRSTRQRLLGDPATSPEQPAPTDPSQEGLMESVVVLEEFCKELAAIAFVKYHLHSPPGP